ncbi:MAG TPA: hypothetical protein VMB26_14370, partial [Candidatus Binataceae bacterium]|nr:hypothetical protein [Candidatus Binataceae bacterium]
SQLLYYRKYHGAIGAWLSMFLETSWNRLKMLRYLGANTADLQAKSKESQVVLAMLRQAWRETQGGQICPPRPW